MYFNDDTEVIVTFGFVEKLLLVWWISSIKVDTPQIKKSVTVSIEVIGENLNGSTFKL